MASAILSYDVVNPTALNDATRNLAPLQGLIGARLSVERGLFAPDWSHFVEFGLHSGSAEGGEILASNSRTQTFTNSFKYISILPVGITWWVNRTAYIDVGFSFAAGFGLSPEWTLIDTLDTVVQSTKITTGGMKLIGEGRIHGRFWLGKHLGLVLGGAFRNFVPNLDTGANPRKASMNNADILIGMTFAFGGVRGTGRTFVELLPADKPKDEIKGAPLKPDRPKGLPPAKR